MKRFAALAAGLLLAVVLLPGCSSSTPAATAESSPKTTIRIGSMTGPTTMGLVHLMSDAEADQGAQDYQVTVYGTPDELVPRIVQGQVDVALIPANLASVLYNRTLGADGSQIAVAAINTLGVLEVVEAGDTVRGMADLEGRTVYSTGKGASPEWVLSYLLRSNDLDPATDVTVEYKSEAAEVAALLAATPGAIGVLPQPYATVLQAQSPDVRSALSLTQEWAEVNPASQLVTGVVVVRTAFAAENPAAFDDFLTDYEASTEFTNAYPEQAAALITEAGITPTTQVAEAAIPACNITYIEGADLQALLSGYLEVLFEADAASVGGSLPGDDFYYRR